MTTIFTRTDTICNSCEQSSQSVTWKTFSPIASPRLPQRTPSKVIGKSSRRRRHANQNKASETRTRETRREAKRWGTKAPRQEASPSAIVSVRSVTMGRCRAPWVPPPQPLWFWREILCRCSIKRRGRLDSGTVPLSSLAMASFKSALVVLCLGELLALECVCWNWFIWLFIYLVW